ncbi:MAG: phenylalanine--tRNA ligase subunit beta [Betaproteobacteria bacterium]|nr:phenylalanine--tRNA ligase subunit beta [Betaproteobacteria bacterium]
MKFSERWLRTLVNPPLSTEALAHALTMAGLEVEGIEPAAPAFSGVVVGEIVAMSRHPNADRLNVCQVNSGGGARLQVVCGAPNARVGMKAPLARVGARLPQLEIKASNLRGVESQGMLCSAAELGVKDDSSGLLELASDAPAGADFREYWQLDDALLTLKLTPNRGDCLSMLGIAREVAAITGAALHAPVPHEQRATLTDTRAVTLRNPEGCPLYCGRVMRGIRSGARTPHWIVARLERAGLRGISPVVDATNYVMLEIGQPMHAFDLDKLNGDIHVRFGKPGERLTVLNGEEIAIASDLLVIADDAGPVALAGVMGGLHSGVGAATTNLFLEAAYFEPKVIAGRSRRLELSSDAAHRFERGVDFGGTRQALERLTQIIAEICGGEAGPVVEARSALPVRKPVSVRLARAQRVLGIPLQGVQAERILDRLQLPWTARGDRYEVTPPSFRFDIEIEEDLIEELGRIHGYDAIPPALPRVELVVAFGEEKVSSDADLRAKLVARGYQEIITFSFVPKEWERDFGGKDDAIELANPIASHLQVMRSQLFGSLIECLQQNLNRKRDSVRIFEMGRCYMKEGAHYNQPLLLGGLVHGSAAPEQWGVPARWADYFDVKGDLGALLGHSDFIYGASGHPAFHPGKSAEIRIGGTRIGCLGELHPQWVQKYELPHPPVLFELGVEALRNRDVPRFQEFSRLPVVTRDLAVLVPEAAAAGDVLRSLLAHRMSIVQDIVLFDLYRGKGVEAGRKSLAFRVLLQDTQKTLTDTEVETAVQDLLEHLLRKFDGRLRD